MIYKTKEFISPTMDEMKEIHRRICDLLKKEYEIEITDIREIEDGQNLNYLMYGYQNDRDRKIKLFLKIISKDGYPDIETLNKAYELLKSNGFKYYNIIHHDTSSHIAPYGFIVQEWVEGEVRVSNGDFNIKEAENQVDNDILWLRDYANVLKRVHSIKLEHFGDIKGDVKFENINDYYDNIDEVIRWSFGNVIDGGIILDDLVEKEILDEKFLRYVLEKVSCLGRKISSKDSILIYGDMFPSNIIYKGDEPRIIDWDECRANWWVYEIARTTYYIESRELTMKFIEYYKPEDSLEEIDIGIRIEHVKQHLRRLCIMCMNREKDQQLMDKIEKLKEKIIDRLENRFLWNNNN
ncbi:aminoglycoside phosphotransferase family protein [Oceanirhabdus sp. W0125-5]|uniref:aminoglycoside phosphotransferase family protein n=1 Tax=Oceanirhabdus sp. W0125-5 TaxID=2999116 RepID=UPI0022F33570|nr:aminoglycoside phosphotransferase family protein [Oceanirhabdus sp. W0125-5]WBW96429.1 aminoglycoside phosphotransferase family protein [Oceanirhabdus sp. W0125-5]